ncbi:MAG: nucleotidyltransferase family protein [Eubacteriales bacterium]|nr:nucleotidyltransferase family protein [Eubacteriales bacterium]
MQVCAIISEYNPFHAGHLYQIREIRRRLPGCLIVSIMSGNYVQRGEPALWDKYLRAQCAVTADGPDLVIELPIPAALSSAEGFARGGVQLAAALGCVTHLSFGCETGTEKSLMQLAACLDSATFDDHLRKELTNGISYAQAASRAAAVLCPDCASLLDSPNDMLAVQYCRALRKIAPSIQPLAVRRYGAAHDGAPIDEIPSASYIRSLFHTGRDTEAISLLPDACRNAGKTARRHSWADLDDTVLRYLRRISPEYIRTLPDVSEGLENRFAAACRDAADLSEAWDLARSRRYPLSRIRRLTLCAYLGITDALSSLPPSFVTVLAMNQQGRQILKQLKTSCSLPVIVKPTQAHTFPPGTPAQQLWTLTMQADDQYYFPSPAGTGWKKTPFCAKDK